MSNRRQRLSMKDLVDIYVPEPPLTSGDLSEVQEMQYPEYPTYTNVRCGMHSSPANMGPNLMGRTQEDIIFTMDRFYFDMDVDMDDSYLLEIRTPGSVLRGFFWTVMGDPKIRENRGRRRPNYQSVYARRQPKPTNIPDRLD